MAIALSTRETLPTEVTMDDFRGKRRLTGAIDDACGFIDDELEKWYEEYKASRKDHELHFEISIAWDDDDEFEHEGYYHSVDDAIEALLRLKQMEKDFQEDKNESCNSIFRLPLLYQ